MSLHWEFIILFCVQSAFWITEESKQIGESHKKNNHNLFAYLFYYFVFIIKFVHLQSLNISIHNCSMCASFYCVFSPQCSWLSWFRRSLHLESQNNNPNDAVLQHECSHTGSSPVQSGPPASAEHRYNS